MTFPPTRFPGEKEGRAHVFFCNWRMLNWVYIVVYESLMAAVTSDLFFFSKFVPRCLESLLAAEAKMELVETLYGLWKHGVGEISVALKSTPQERAVISPFFFSSRSAFAYLELGNLTAGGNGMGWDGMAEVAGERRTLCCTRGFAAALGVTRSTVR